MPGTSKERLHISTTPNTDKPKKRVHPGGRQIRIIGQRRQPVDTDRLVKVLVNVIEKMPVDEETRKTKK
ncbi:MAG: hypothetical protein GY788_18370 [bacterium]|nr:hypothetical protein [bacterium]